ncbi:MAG: hypothetical protein LBQ66_12475, partial [Planctomycetaceae bacterium]|nr:hypothetical protein [Planctomycetaceae bacterium]
NQENNHTITPDNTTNHKTHRQGKVGNRPLGGCVGVLADSGIAKTHRQNQSALRFGRFGFVDACTAPTVFGLLRSPKTQPPSGRLTTLCCRFTLPDATARRAVEYLTLTDVLSDLFFVRKLVDLFCQESVRHNATS